MTTRRQSRDMTTHAARAIDLLSLIPRPDPVRLQPIPPSAHGLNLRAVLRPVEWDKFRKPVMAAVGNRCEICGGVGTRHPVEAHEWWDFDTDTSTCRLVRLLVLCPTCHSMQHFGRTPHLQPADILRYLHRVNGWPPAECISHLKWSMARTAQLSKLKWRLDTSVVGIEVLDDGGWQPC